MIDIQTPITIECFAQPAQLIPDFFLDDQANIQNIPAYLVYCPETDISVRPVIAVKDSTENREFANALLSRMYTTVNWLKEKNYINISQEDIHPAIPEIGGVKALLLVFSENLPENTLAKTVYQRPAGCFHICKLRENTSI